MIREALFFSEVSSFSDFVSRIGVRGQQSAPLELCEVTLEETSRDPSYLLFGYKTPKQLGLFGELLVKNNTLRVEDRGASLRWTSASQQAVQAQVLSRREEGSLLALVPLLPWEKEPEPLGKVLFWLRDRALMNTIARASLQLGNDRIQYTSLLHEGSEVLLLSIETPAEYLLQACQEEWKEQVDLYLAVNEEMFVQWGFEHPLVDKWQKAEKGERLWSFLRASGERLQLRSLKWQDIYQATDFVLDFSLHPVPAEVSSQEVELQIPLRLEPRTHALRADLWMIRGNAIREFENLLAFAHEDLLHELLISPQTDEDGEPLLLLRERRQGELVRHFDFETLELTTMEDFHNLLLPSNRDLLPQLNRPQYTRIFQLKKGELTILLDGGKSNQPYHLLKLQENSFRPLSAWIDFVMLEATETLKKKLGESTFSWGVYENAPSHPELLQKKKSQRVKQSRAKQANQDSLTQETTTTEIEKKTTKRNTSRPRKTGETVTRTKASLSQLGLEEKEAELAVIELGASVERWLSLAEVKSALSKRADVVECFVEALWLVREEDEDRRILGEWRNQLCSLLGIEGSVGSQLKSLQHEVRNTPTTEALVAYILAAEWVPLDQLNEWLPDVTRLLKADEGKLRKKVRWLVWREILQRNKDVREQARFFESLLGELNDQGVVSRDIPAFLQERLLQERLEASENDEVSGDLSFAFSMLDALSREWESLQPAGIRDVFATMLSYAYARLGAFSFGDETQKRVSLRQAELSALTQAWIALFLVQTDQLHNGSFLDGEWTGLEKRRSLLDTEDRKTLERVEKSILARKKTRSPAELLAKLNQRPLYPNRVETPGSAERMAKRSEKNYKEGQNAALVRNLQNTLKYLTEEVTYKHVKIVSLCKASEIVVSLMSKQLDSEFLSKMKEPVEKVSAALQKMDLNDLVAEGAIDSAELMYLPMLQSAIARCLMMCNNESEAARLMEFIVASLGGSSLAPLDYLDTSVEVVKAIELMPLSQRFNLVSSFGEHLKAHMEGYDAAFYQSESVYRWLFPLVDQLIESTMSKERWTLERYKQYLDRDELLIRERLLHEDLCDPRPYNKEVSVFVH